MVILKADSNYYSVLSGLSPGFGSFQDSVFPASVFSGLGLDGPVRHGHGFSIPTPFLLFLIVVA